MKYRQYLIAPAVLLFVSCFATAQNNAAAGANGTIIEQSSYAFPTYEQLPGWARQIYTKETFEGLRNSPELELLRIKYVSDGLKVVGFIYKPRIVEGKKLPVIIWNRGGANEDAKIANNNFHDIYEMYRYAAAGFVVIASQYRGIDGGEGKDEMGGADVDDVMNLVPLAKSLGYVDLNKLCIWGFSRGAQMALQAIRRGLPVKAAVLVGVPTDWESTLKDSPNLLPVVRELWPDWERRREEHLKERSAIGWVDQLNVPLLIFQGAADPVISTTRTMTFAQRLDESGKVYELLVYAGDDHPVDQHREERLSRTIAWFKNPRKMSIAREIERTLRLKGQAAANKEYFELKKNQLDIYDFSERELNQLGYILLAKGRATDAVEIFKLNVAAFPESANTYDSLAEGYVAVGNRELAIRNYTKSLELNPQNTNATDALKKLAPK